MNQHINSGQTIEGLSRNQLELWSLYRQFCSAAEECLTYNPEHRALHAKALELMTQRLALCPQKYSSDCDNCGLVIGNLLRQEISAACNDFRQLM